MAKHNVSSNAFCPFYRYDERALICCEGILPGSTFHIAFSTTKNKDEYFAARCSCQRFQECAIAKTLERHYETGGMRGMMNQKAGGEDDAKRMD